jgi:hypothetical protein
MYAKLTAWYFSESGGLLLTPQARDFYFALQDLLRVTANLRPGWSVDRSKESEDDADVVFRSLVRKTKNAEEAISVLDYFSTNAFQRWEDDAIDLGKRWRDAMKDLGKHWNDLSESQRFATLQQVGSKLRTSLVNDLESRLR